MFIEQFIVNTCTIQVVRQVPGKLEAHLFLTPMVLSAIPFDLEKENGP